MCVKSVLKCCCGVVCVCCIVCVYCCVVVVCVFCGVDCGVFFVCVRV